MLYSNPKDKVRDMNVSNAKHGKSLRMVDAPYALMSMRDENRQIPLLLRRLCLRDSPDQNSSSNVPIRLPNKADRCKDHT